MNNISEQAIIAQCTPVGSGAIALLRISGVHAFSTVSKFTKLPSGKNFEWLESHTVQFGYVVNDSQIIDQVMFIVMRAPKTFTGEDVIEITCHNNQFIIEEIINLAIKFGVRLAQPGEFAKRAFLNGKMDLLQAESINELIHASNQQALKKSLSQISGSFSEFISGIEKKLLHCLALSESSFEFLDDEIEFGIQIKELVQSILEKIKNLKTSFNNQKNIREGIRVAILGSVNAGKSSLFNALIKTERAIVTDIAGTTRDVIEAGVYKKDCFVTYVDTAGIRQTEDVIEKEGIRRSFEEAKKADIILLVIDSTRELTQQEKDIYNQIIDAHDEKIIFVLNKCDDSIHFASQNAHHERNRKYIKVSTKNNLGLDHLENLINQRISKILDLNTAPFLINKRHYNLLSDLENRLESIVNLLSKEQIEYEILSINLKEALEGLSELTGKTITEMGMDAVFKEFCVGK